jgi:hypothetical protein
MLVGGFNHLEKYESVGMIIPNIWKVKHVPNHQPVVDELSLEAPFRAGIFQPRLMTPELPHATISARLAKLSHLVSGYKML